MLFLRVYLLTWEIYNRNIKTPFYWLNKHPLMGIYFCTKSDNAYSAFGYSDFNVSTEQKTEHFLTGIAILMHLLTLT